MIMLTGGAGYIGSHLCVELLNLGEDVLVADNLSNAKPTSLERVRELTGRKIPFEKADILDTKRMTELLGKYPIEGVIHLAGLKSATASVADPLGYYRDNVAGTVSLLEAMREKDVRKMLFSSSAAVYGLSNRPPYTEDMPIARCANPYGQTKATIELILEALAGTGGWHIGMLRYFNAVGAHESGRIGEDPSGRPANLCPAIAQTAVGRLPYLEINGLDFDTPDGSGVRDYIHVTDLARGHVAAWRRLGDIDGARVWNLGTGRGVSVLDMLETFRRVTGEKIPSRVASRRLGDLAVAIADVSRAAEELGWHAEFGLEKIVEDTWRWQKNNPRGYDSQ